MQAVPGTMTGKQAEASGLPHRTNKGEELPSRLKAEYAVPRACSGVLLSHKVTFSFPGAMVSTAESRRKQMGR